MSLFQLLRELQQDSASRSRLTVQGGQTTRSVLIPELLIPECLIPKLLIPELLIPECLIPKLLIPELLIPESQKQG